MNFLAKWFYFKVLGWKLIGEFPKELDKYVIIVVPHTSWTDLIFGILIRSITGIRPKFLGKKSLFFGPLGTFLRSIGGISVDRKSSKNFVQTMVSMFDTSNKMILTICPEGTRKKVDTWKTGFYHIAKEADVPIVKVALDYGEKQIKIGEVYHTTNNEQHDFNYFYQYFEGTLGRYPELT